MCLLLAFVFTVIVVVGVAGWFLVIIGGCAHWCSVVHSLASLFMWWVGVVSGAGQAVRCRGMYLVSAVGIPWFTTSPMGPPSFECPIHKDGSGVLAALL